jgi:penicillin-binding protein 2
MPSAEWKLRSQHDRWFAGETINVSIGQGALTVTPLQLTRAIAGLAMGGVWYRPHLVRPAATELLVVHRFDPRYVTQVIDAMYGVVNEAGGTGRSAELPGIGVCGKTGTAQVASADFVRSHGGAGFRDNAWFVGFAPCESPEIVVTAFYEHGGESREAVPIVRDVLKAYFDKKRRAAP